MALDLRGMTPLLPVFDMPTSVRFYRDVLGFEMVGDSGAGEDSGWVLLRRGDIELMLNTAYDTGQRPPSPEPARVAHHDDVGLYFGCSDLDAAYEHLRRQGLPVRPPEVRPYGMRQLSVKDPDGYGLCLQWPAG